MAELPAPAERPLRVACLAGGAPARAAIEACLGADPVPHPVDLVLPDAAPGTTRLLRSWSRAGDRLLARRDIDVLLWCGPLEPGPMRAALLSSRLPALGIDIPAPPRAGAQERRQVRQTLGRFARVLARDAETARALAEAGPPGLRIEVAGPLVPVPAPLPCNAAERADLAATLGTRPVWLAAHPTQAEIPDILAAHHAARRMAHRLLLLLVPAPGSDGSIDGGPLAADLRGMGWTVARRAQDDDLVEGTDIYLADTQDEMGLWYRIAPVTVLGGTLRGGAVPDLAGPASLGSALVVGPGGDAAVARFAQAAAALRAETPEALGAALSDALSPDRAATLASAAWDVVTEGAPAQARLRAALRDLARERRP